MTELVTQQSLFFLIKNLDIWNKIKYFKKSAIWIRLSRECIYQILHKSKEFLIYSIKKILIHVFSTIIIIENRCAWCHYQTDHFTFWIYLYHFDNLYVTHFTSCKKYRSLERLYRFVLLYLISPCFLWCHLFHSQLLLVLNYY